MSNLEKMADSVVLAVKAYIADAIGPRMDKLERELAAAKSTIEQLRQGASATRKEVSALTKRALTRK